MLGNKIGGSAPAELIGNGGRARATVEELVALPVRLLKMRTKVNLAIRAQTKE